MIAILDTNDTRAARNKDMILDHYDRMINHTDTETGTGMFEEKT